MYVHNIDPVLLKIGFLELRYYGLFYVIGLIIIYFMVNYLAKRKNLNISKDDTADLLLYLTIGMLLGARLIYAAVYNLAYYIENTLKILAIWEGGMSFHGALIGIL